MKKALSIILSASMVLSLSPIGNFDVYAATDVQESVTAYCGQDIEVGNVKVTDDAVAVSVISSQISSERPDSYDASVKVKGDISLKNNDSFTDTAYGSYVYAYNGKATLDVTGGITVDSSYPYGLYLYESYYSDYDTSVEAKVGGDILVNADNYATGLYSYGDNIKARVNGDITVNAYDSQGIGVCRSGEYTVNGNVTADASYKYSSDNEEDREAVGVDLSGNKNIKVKIGGDIYAKGTFAEGVSLGNGYSGMLRDNFPDQEKDIADLPDGDIIFTAGKSIKAESIDTGIGFDYATGLSVNNRSQKIVADIKGDITADSPNDNSVGIQIRTNNYKLEVASSNDNDDGGSSDIRVHGNVLSDGVGINFNTNSKDIANKILVENKIVGKEVGVCLTETKGGMLVGDSADDEETNPLELTAWSITPNDRGNVAEKYEEKVIYIEPRYEEPLMRNAAVGSEAPELEAAPEFEKTINYIIKTEQPKEGGSFTVTDKDGNALAKSYNFEVAHEGDKVLIKPDINDGYELKAVYNGVDEKTELSKDDSGNYFLEVPKGGGVYLSLKVEKKAEPTPTPEVTATPEPSAQPTATPTPEKIEDVEKKIKKMSSEADLTNAEFGKCKLKVKKVGKKSISYSWQPVEGATKYVIYANKCNHLYKCKKIAEVTGTSFTLKKIKGKKLKVGTYYKLLVVAADDENNVISTSKVVHCATKGGKRTNYKSIKVTNVKNKKLSLKKGWSFDLEYKTTKVKKGGVIKVHRPVSFESDNTAVATVNSKGQIKAKSKGKCKIYAYTQNGIYTTINITVK